MALPSAAAVSEAALADGSLGWDGCARTVLCGFASDAGTAERPLGAAFCSGAGADVVGAGCCGTVGIESSGASGAPVATGGSGIVAGRPNGSLAISGPLSAACDSIRLGVGGEHHHGFRERGEFASHCRANFVSARAAPRDCVSAWSARPCTSAGAEIPKALGSR